MDYIINHFNRQSKSSLLIRGYITLALIGLIDYLTGSELSLFVFYFFPIIIIAWYVGKKSGLYVAVTSAVLTLLHDYLFINSFPMFHLSDLYVVWNFIQRVIVLVIVSLTVSALRKTEIERLECEIKVAKQVQSFFLPQKFPPLNTMEYVGVRKSFSAVSGDFYDFLPIPTDNLAMVVGDICGKGMSAALLMAHIHGILRSNVHKLGNDLTNLIQTINNSLYASTEDNKFATLFTGIYNDVEKKMTYINAGHNPPIVLRLENGIEENLRSIHNESAFRQIEILRLNTESLILGIDPESNYQPKDTYLKTGDVILIFTDGITEAMNSAKEQYDEDRLIRLVSLNMDKSSSDICKLIFDDIAKFIGIEPQLDDMTLVVGKVR